MGRGPTEDPVVPLPIGSARLGRARQAILGGIGIGLRPREEVLRGVRDGSLVHVLPGWGFDPPAVSILSPPEVLKVARMQVVAEALERAARVLG